MPAQEHVHKYRRIDIGRRRQYWVMQCSLPKCQHYVAMEHKEYAPALVGKIALCNRCNEPFELDKLALTKKFPTCKDCIDSPRQKEIKKASKFFEDLEKMLTGTDNQ